MRHRPDINALSSELLAKKAMLIDLESGDISHGGSFESRGHGVHQRILRIQAEIAAVHSHRRNPAPRTI